MWLGVTPRAWEGLVPSLQPTGLGSLQDVTGLSGDVPDRVHPVGHRRGAAGVSVDWLKADVAGLGALGLEPGFTLAFDRGCFHGLGDDERAGYAAGVTALAAPGATLLMMAFGPNRVLAAPAGVEETEIVARFAGWDLVSTQPDTEGEIAGPLRNVPRAWYRLIRR